MAKKLTRHENVLAEWMLQGYSVDDFEPTLTYRPGQLVSILSRWLDKGWIETGGSVLWSWLTEEGRAALGNK